MKSGRDHGSRWPIRIDEMLRMAHVEPANENVPPIPVVDDEFEDMDVFEIEFEPDEETRH